MFLFKRRKKKLNANESIMVMLQKNTELLNNISIGIANILKVLNTSSQLDSKNEDIIKIRAEQNRARRAEEITKKVESMGDKLLKMHKELLDMYLNLEKIGKDTTTIKAQLDLLDLIIRGEI